MMIEAKDTILKSSISSDGSVHFPTLEEQAEVSYKAGLKQGIWLFAWWKDGTQYVGTCGKTLKEVLEEIDRL